MTCRVGVMYITRKLLLAVGLRCSDSVCTNTLTLYYSCCLIENGMLYFL